MNFLRKGIGIRLFCWLFACHFFNCSLDAPDAFRDGRPEDLSINEMESFVEWVLEKGLEMPAAFPEQDESDSEEGLDWKLSKFVLELRVRVAPIPLYEQIRKLEQGGFPHPPLRFDPIYYDVASPPPWHRG